MPDRWQNQSDVPVTVRRGCLSPRLIMALLMVALAVGGYYCSTRREYNPVTGEVQRVSLTTEQEVALGLQAAPQMASEHGGEHPDPSLQAVIDKVGNKLVAANARGDHAKSFGNYQFDFHLLRDPQTVNAFALPGGQVFITFGLYKLLGTEDEVAGVLAHEIGHVVGRHSNEQMARSKMWAGIAQGVAMAGSDYTMSSGQIAQLVYTMKTTAYGRDDELESDKLGVKFMINAGYDPEGLIRLMEVLEKSSGGGGAPEFLSTHPNPGNRVEHIRDVIAKTRAEAPDAAGTRPR
jgi:predicted Zn-dependent protease